MPKVSRSRLVLWLAVALAGLVLTFWAVRRTRVAGREAELERSWNEAQAWLKSFEERFPETAANEPALFLEKEAARLGIVLVPAQEPNRLRSSAEEAESFGRIRAALKEYLERHLARPDDLIEEPPEGVREYLRAHGDALSGLSRKILVHDPPAWERDVARGPDAPVPNLLGHIHFQRVLLADALRRAGSGERQQAERMMEAAWKLNEGLQSRPEMISQITAIAIARWQLAALRKMDGLEPAWVERIQDQDARRGFIQALELQAFSFAKGMKESGLPETWWSPGPRREIVSYTGNTRELAEEIGKENPCSYDSERARRLWEKRFPRWSFGEIFFPNSQESLHRMFRLLLESELTAKLFQAKAARAASPDSAWPRELEGLSSSVCPGARWDYRVAGETMTISFAGDFPEWLQSGTLKLPLSHTAGHPRLLRKVT